MRTGLQLAGQITSCRCQNFKDLSSIFLANAVLIDQWP